MAEGLKLYGFADSVYTHVILLALSEMGVDASYVEADPFSDPPDPALLKVNPFGRVPVLCHGEFVLTETAAILRYLDALSGKRSLIPSDAKAQARMQQVGGIVDAYAYWPLVRQVYSHAVYGPRHGEKGDAETIEQGLAASHRPLAALNGISAEAVVLGGAKMTLADLHLAPMIAAFVQAPQGRAALDQYTALARWWDRVSQRPAFARILAGS